MGRRRGAHLLEVHPPASVGDLERAHVLEQLARVEAEVLDTQRRREALQQLREVVSEQSKTQPALLPQLPHLAEAIQILGCLIRDNV